MIKLIHFYSSSTTSPLKDNEVYRRMNLNLKALNSGKYIKVI